MYNEIAVEPLEDLGIYGQLLAMHFCKLSQLSSPSYIAIGSLYSTTLLQNGPFSTPSRVYTTRSQHWV